MIVLEGDEVDKDPGQFAVEAKTTSLFGDKRVIRVRNAGKGVVAVLSEIKDDLGGVAIIARGRQSHAARTRCARWSRA